MGQRVLVCGGRYFTDAVALSEVLNEYDISHLIEGGAKGADRLAREWAAVNGVEFTEFMADWTKYGKGAGPKRNHDMLTQGEPDFVIAFFDRPESESRGTANMVMQAERAGVPVRRVFSIEVQQCPQT